MIRWRIAASIAALLLFAAGGVRADDTVTYAVTAITAWDSSPVPFGIKLGFFSEHGLKVNIAQTDSAADILQALISGSADVGVVAVPTFIGAAASGAPIKMISSAFRGTSDLVWFARSDSKIKSFKDITAGTTLGVNTLGGSQYPVLAALLKQYGVSGKFVVTGNRAATLAQVMAGQIDVGTNGNALLGVPQLASGEIRIVAYGSELESMRNVSVRAFAATSETIAKRRDVLLRFLQAYQESVDWMYSHPEAVQWNADLTQSTLEDAKRVVADAFPKAAFALGEISQLDVSIAQGLEFKRIPQAPSPEQIAAMVDVIWKPQ